MNLEADQVSIDMIDFIIDLNDYEFTMMIRPIVDMFVLDEHIEYWESFAWNKYRHNWKYQQDYIDDDGIKHEYSFYFSYSNNISQDLKTRFRLSYNPNKVPEDDRVLSYILHILRFEEEQLQVQSFDIAFDYQGITTSDLIFDKGRKREYKIMKYQNSDLTYYLGKKGSGQIKIYDKANEESFGKADYNKTRYELTINEKIYVTVNDMWKFTGEIPTLYINQVVGLFENENLSPGDKVLIYAITHGLPMDKLEKRQRRKCRELMEGMNQTYTKIEPSRQRIEKTLKDFVTQLIY